MVHSNLKQNQPEKSCIFGVSYAAVLPEARGFRHGTTRPGASPLGLERGRKPRMRLILNGEGSYRAYVLGGQIARYSGTTNGADCKCPLYDSHSVWQNTQRMYN